VRNVKKSYRGFRAPADHLPDSPGSSSNDGGGALLEKYPWAKRMKAALDGGAGESSTTGPRMSSGGSGSGRAPADSGSGSCGTATPGDRLSSGGVSAGGSSPSARIHAPGQPFYELRNLVEDPATEYSHGLALMVARFGDIPTMQAFKARGWLKEAAAENSWLSGALLGRRSERGSGGRS